MTDQIKYYRCKKCGWEWNEVGNFSCDKCGWLEKFQGDIKENKEEKNS